MKQIEMWVEGTMPLLINRPLEEDLIGKTRANTITEEPDPRIVAGSHVYRVGTNQLAFPGQAFLRQASEAGSGHKAKGSRKSLRFIVPAALIITDDLCPIFELVRKTPITDFEVDSRPVTIPSTKGKIMRYRARINRWTLQVNMKINENVIEPKIVRQLLTEGGQQIGLGDFRPQKSGPFGTWSIVSWEEVM